MLTADNMPYIYICSGLYMHILDMDILDSPYSESNDANESKDLLEKGRC